MDKMVANQAETVAALESALQTGLRSASARSTELATAAAVLGVELAEWANGDQIDYTLIEQTKRIAKGYRDMSSALELCAATLDAIKKGVENG